MQSAGKRRLGQIHGRMLGHKTSEVESKPDRTARCQSDLHAAAIVEGEFRFGVETCKGRSHEGIRKPADGISRGILRVKPVETDAAGDIGPKSAVAVCEVIDRIKLQLISPRTQTDTAYRWSSESKVVDQAGGLGFDSNSSPFVPGEGCSENSPIHKL
jgi:hypothetical protein